MKSCKAIRTKFKFTHLDQRRENLNSFFKFDVVKFVNLVRCEIDIPDRIGVV